MYCLYCPDCDQWSERRRELREQLRGAYWECRRCGKREFGKGLFMIAERACEHRDRALGTNTGDWKCRSCGATAYAPVNVEIGFTTPTPAKQCRADVNNRHGRRKLAAQLRRGQRP